MIKKKTIGLLLLAMIAIYFSYCSYQGYNLMKGQQFKVVVVDKWESQYRGTIDYNIKTCLVDNKKACRVISSSRKDNGYVVGYAYDVHGSLIQYSDADIDTFYFACFITFCLVLAGLFLMLLATLFTWLFDAD